MDEELTEAAEDLAAAVTPAEGEKAPVPPRNAGKRQRDALLHRVKRKLPNLSPAKLELLDKAEVGELERILEEGANPKPVLPVVQVQLEPGQKPGWPPPSAMKDWAQLAHLASIIPPFTLELGAKRVPALQHWAQAFMERKISLGEQEFTIAPQKQLSEGLAGLAAQYLGPGPGTSPAASIVVAGVSVAIFGALDFAKAVAERQEAEGAPPEKKPEVQP